MPPKINNLANICKKVEELARKTYIPVISDSTQNQSFTESKFGGKPFIHEPKYPWPICECGDKQNFFLQLNSDTMPASLKVNENYFDGLLQMFYCIKCSNYEPFSKTQNLRLVKKVDLNNSQTIDGSNQDVDEFPFKRISDWTEEIDYVHQTELVEDVDESIQGNYDALDYISENYKTKAGEKFLGWPDWVQGVEYPNCRVCNNRMRFLFQVDSEYNIPFMWGDVGCGHISQCEQHKDEITFTWACH
jgi:uncharacterized protein YwqG